VFGFQPLPRTLNAALRDSEHQRRDVRSSALRDLVRHARGEARERAVSALIERLRSDPEIEVRAQAAVALADADATESLDALLAAARQGEPPVRQMALLALGEIAPEGHEETLALLELARRAHEPALRFQALIALHRVGGASAEPFVLEALGDADPEVRAMGFRCAEERFAERELPQALLDSAVKALSDEVEEVRVCAAIVLANGGDPRGGDVLLRVVDGSSKAGTDADRQAAIELVAELGLPGAERALERRAFGPLGLRPGSLAYHARTALAKLGHARAKESILRGLRGFTRDTRTLSVVAAGRARLVDALPLITAMAGREERADQTAVEEALASLRGLAER
jgi:HEAT repeat protein